MAFKFQKNTYMRVKLWKSYLKKGDNLDHKHILIRDPSTQEPQDFTPLHLLATPYHCFVSAKRISMKLQLELITINFLFYGRNVLLFVLLLNHNLCKFAAGKFQHFYWVHLKLIMYLPEHFVCSLCIILQYTGLHLKNIISCHKHYVMYEPI